MMPTLLPLPQQHSLLSPHVWFHNYLMRESVITHLEWIKPKGRQNKQYSVCAHVCVKMNHSGFPWLSAANSWVETPRGCVRLHGGSVSTVWASHPHPCLHTCPGQGSGTAPPTTGPGVPPGSQPGPRAAWAPGAGAKAGPGPQASISAQQVPLATYPARLPPGHMAQGREAWAVAFRPGLGPRPGRGLQAGPGPPAEMQALLPPGPAGPAPLRFLGAGQNI